MNYYYKGDSRSVSHRITGRMSLGEMISLLTHLNSESQFPWMNAFHYSYDQDTNETFVVVSVTNDRPHNHDA